MPLPDGRDSVEQIRGLQEAVTEIREVIQVYHSNRLTRIIPIFYELRLDRTGANRLKVLERTETPENTERDRLSNHRFCVTISATSETVNLCDLSMSPRTVLVRPRHESPSQGDCIPRLVCVHSPRRVSRDSCPVHGVN